VNLVELAQANVPRFTCRCGLAVRLTSGVWLDGSGSPGCWDNNSHVGRLYVDPSPTLFWTRRDP
jgi:hypothetical protein